MKYGFINTCLADQWSEPRFNSERLNQLLFSEIVEYQPSRDRFVKAADLSGYEGWVDKHFVTEAPKASCLKYASSRNVIVTSFNARTFERVAAMSETGPLRMAYGTRFTGTYDKKTGWYTILLPDKTRCMVGGTSCEPIKHFASKASGGRLVMQARRLLGVPYLWGGTSAFGFDCSGLVKSVYSFFGVDLPRDTKDQINIGAVVYRKELRAGDLAFFDRHVAIACGGGLILHCSAGGGTVRVDSIDKRSKTHEYREDLDKSFRLGRRIL